MKINISTNSVNERLCQQATVFVEYRGEKIDIRINLERDAGQQGLMVVYADDLALVLNDAISECLSRAETKDDATRRQEAAIAAGTDLGFSYD